MTATAGPSEHQHDLFVVHADADVQFVEGYLLPAVGLDRGRVLLSSELTPGMPRTTEIERGVQASRLTVVVLSPAYMADRWAIFGEQLAGHLGEGRLVPLLLAQCDVPLRLDSLVSLDFRDPDQRADEARRLREHLGQPTPEEIELPCPYPGMRPYSASSAAHFHGREAEVAEIVGRLRAGERELYVIGPSGSGKSSLVAAGVVPALARGSPGLGPFLVRSLRPGERPATRLAQALEGDIATPVAAIEALLGRDGRSALLLLVIDQLEELFTLATADERARFVEALRALRADPRCVVVLTLRADFYGAFMLSPLWTDLGGRISRIEVAPLRGPALRAAIERPARDLGVHLEPDLVERLLGEAAAEPGILPLLQDALIQLWDRRHLRLLTLAAYQGLGEGGRSGLALAICRRANATLTALTLAQEAIARRTFLRLVSFGEGRSDTRRQQPLSALRVAGDKAADFDTVVQRLVDGRLITVDRDGDGTDARVDLAHEVMITTWRTLADWIRAHRADEQRRRQLEMAAALWSERGRGDGGLLDPIELAEAEAWRKTESARALGDSSTVAALVAASRATHARQQRRRRAALGASIVALVVFTVVVAILAIKQRRLAVREKASRELAEQNFKKYSGLLISTHRETARRFVVEGRPLQALPYLLATRKEGDEAPSLRLLFGAATRNLPQALLQHQAPVSRAVFSQDGKRVVTASDDKTARIWDASTGKPVSPPLEHRGAVKHAAFSHDGTRVITASMDYTARVWDASTGKPVSPPLEHESFVVSAAFSLDGRLVVTTSNDSTARVWDASTGKSVSPPLKHGAPVMSAAFSLDGKRVVTASNDGTARIWDASTGDHRAPPLEHRGAVKSAMFSRDGTRVVTASLDGTARIWNASTGKLVAPALEHDGGVRSATFSWNGTRVVTASFDWTARIWDASTGKFVAALEHGGAVRSAMFSRDGTRVVTASDDNTARIWDASTGKPLSPFLEHSLAVNGAAFSPDGALVVTASNDNTARIWDAAITRPLLLSLGHPERGEKLAAPRGCSSTATSACIARVIFDSMWGFKERPLTNAAFSPDGARVVASEGKTVRVWDVSTGMPLSPALEHAQRVTSAAFSPNGAYVVTASWDDTAHVWVAATRRHVWHQDKVRGAAFSPNGARIVTAGTDGTARLWEAATGKLLLPILDHEKPVHSAAFSPTDMLLATTSGPDLVRLFDMSTGAFQVLEGPVNSVAFSPDGKRVVTANNDRSARVWDAATGRVRFRPLEHWDLMTDAAFDPRGARVVTASDDRTARIWDASTGELLAPLLEHGGTVRSATFSPDGALIVTASDDGTARVWDASTGKQLLPALAHPAGVGSAVFSPSGTHILTRSGEVSRLWALPLARGTLEEWAAIEELSPYMLRDGMLVPRPPRAPPGS